MTRRTRVVFAAHRVPADDEVLLALPALSGSTYLKIQSVFIRDENLLRAAALPGTQEVLPSGAVRKLSPLKIDQHFKAMANRLRTRVEALATRQGYPATFKEVDGQGYSALDPLAHDFDFIAITRPDAIVPPAGQSQWYADLLVHCRTTTLFINEPWLSGSCILIAYEGPQSDSALEIAERYARQAVLPLVLIVSKDLPSAQIKHGHRVHRTETQWDNASIAALCRAHDARLLVLGEASRNDWQAVARMLIDSVPCSILQVVSRSPKESE